MIDSSDEQKFFSPFNELGPSELWQKIRSLAANFPSKPYTVAGEKVYNSILNERILPLFQRYPQLSSLLSALIYLYEVEAGANLSQSDFFRNQENQLVLVKAFGYFAEGELGENYSQYQGFFNKLTKELKRLENLIKNQTSSLPNILGSLTLALNEAIHTLPGASSINLKPEGIRKFLAEKTEFNQQYQTLFENFQTAFAPKSSKQ